MEAHTEVLDGIRTSLEHARRAGDLLQQVKDRLKHGEWLPWLAATVDLAANTARE